MLIQKYKKIIFVVTLFVGLFFIYFPVLAKPGDICYSDGIDPKCSDTKDSLCVPFAPGPGGIVQKKCSNPITPASSKQGEPCTTDNDCIQGYTCAKGVLVVGACSSIKNNATQGTLKPGEVCTQDIQCITGSKCIKDSTGFIGSFVGKCSEVTSNNTTPTSKPFVPIEPVLQIKIPTVIFSKIIKEGDILKIPFLADYIIGIYRYAVSIVSIIAVVMIMVGGITYLTAGSSDRIKKAKDTITGAVLGLFLVFGSYILLNSVNSNLLSPDSLNIKYIEYQDLGVLDKGDVCDGFSSAKTPKTISNTTYDSIFQKHASTVGIDWRILKAIAYKESSLDPNDINKSSGAAGLFQIMGKYTKNEIPSTASANCKQALDPDYNTQLGAKMLSTNLNKVGQNCPNAEKNILFTLLYMAHNSGLGAVNCATREKCTIEVQEGKRDPVTTNGGCSLDQIKQGIIAFWNNHWKKKYVGSGRGIKTFNYSVSTANLIMSMIGGSSLSGNTLDCPKNNNTANGTNKILALGDSITASGNSYAIKLKTNYNVDIIASVGQQTSWMWQQITNKNLDGYTHIIILGGINDIYSSGNGVQNAKNNLTKIYQKAKAAGIKIVTITIPPSMGYSKWNQNSIQTQTESLNSWIKSQGDYQIDFYSLIADKSEPRRQDPVYASSDHLHPNSTAHQLLADTIKQTVFSK